MANSKRQKIVDAGIARMETIQTANGFATDLGSNVHDFRTSFQQDELPALSVCDMPAERVPSNSPDPRFTIWSMPLQFRVYAAKETTPAAVREMGKDVMKAIRGAGGQDDRFPVNGIGLAMQTQPRSEGPIINEETFEIEGYVVEIEVIFKTDKFNAEE